MTRMKSKAAILAAAMMLGGCSAVSDYIFPTFDGEDPAATAPNQTSKAQPPGPGGALRAQPAPTPAPPPQMGTSTFVAPAVTPGSPTGTAVGAKVVQIRGELGRLQGSIGEHNRQLQALRAQTVRHSQAYHGTVAAINSRLQVGTTPGNPVLVTQWNKSQTQLDAISRDIALLNSLANRVASDSATSGYLLERTRATYGLTGAVDTDHRQLSVLEDEVNRTVVLVDRLLNELSEDINRQSAYVGQERKNLTTLSVAVKNGELMGASLANRAFGGTAAPGRPRGSIASLGNRRPLVVIRFDRTNVEYEQALYTAVSRALERSPQAFFDLVAVAPGQGTTAQAARGANKARRSAERVLRSLSSMGLPANRVSLSAGTSGQARSAEVHVYIR